MHRLFAFKRISVFIILVIAVFVFSCNKAPEHSFYYWKTTFTLSSTELKCLKDQDISKLYIRFFDVDLEPATGKIVPLGPVSFRDPVPEGLSVVPTIYIVNRTLQKGSPSDISELPARILAKINNLAQPAKIVYKEVQIDCDWTESTREKYFNLLIALRKELKKTDKKLSATIRLHQVKYSKLTGIPPVDKGMLMYYNMGKIDASFGKNSVYNAEDAAKYISSLPAYKLPLDIALPAFSWGIHIRENKVIELLSRMEARDFKNNDTFVPIDSMTFRVNYSMFFHGFYFKKDDVVKVEEIQPELCKTAARQVVEKLNKKPAVVAIFHLDSLILTNYEKKDFEEVFNTFH